MKKIMNLLMIILKNGYRLISLLILNNNSNLSLMLNLMNKVMKKLNCKLLQQN